MKNTTKKAKKNTTKKVVKRTKLKHSTIKNAQERQEQFGQEYKFRSAAGTTTARADLNLHNKDIYFLVVAVMLAKAKHAPLSAYTLDDSKYVNQLIGAKSGTASHWRNCINNAVRLMKLKDDIVQSDLPNEKSEKADHCMRPDKHDDLALATCTYLKAPSAKTWQALLKAFGGRSGLQNALRRPSDGKPVIIAVPQ